MIKFTDSLESSFDDANFIIYGYPLILMELLVLENTALAPDKVREESTILRPIF